MSKQLTISATASVLAMALFAATASAGEQPASFAASTSAKSTGATTKVAAPALSRIVPALFSAH